MYYFSSKDHQWNSFNFTKDSKLPSKGDFKHVPQHTFQNVGLHWENERTSLVDVEVHLERSIFDLQQIYDECLGSHSFSPKLQLDGYDSPCSRALRTLFYCLKFQGKTKKGKSEWEFLKVPAFSNGDFLDQTRMYELVPPFFCYFDTIS